MRRYAEPATTQRGPIWAGLDGELAALVAARAKEEGSTESALPGLKFHRLSSLRIFRKAQYFGPTLTVVTQGRKAVRFQDQELRYDPFRYLVVTGEGTFEGRVLEASVERPFLAVCLELPAELITKTLLTLVDANAEPIEESMPAFASDLDGPVQDAVVRLLKAIDDPLDRQVLAPLVIEELVFRLLRTEAASVMRRAVGRAQEAGAIQEAMRYIREHSGRSLTVDEVAKHVAMSPSHFAHRFRAVARVSPMRYLKQLRLQRARVLMITEGARVSEAATIVGYESPSHFSRDFKSYFGSTPGEYLRRFRVP